MHVFFTSGGGRLANQMLNMAHLYAWYLDNKLLTDKLTVIPFWSYTSIFQAFKNNKYASFPEKSVTSLTIRALHKLHAKMPGTYGRKSLKTALILAKRLPITKVHFESTEAILLDTALWKKLASNKRVLISGWPWRNWELFAKYEKEIIVLLEPHQKFVQPAIIFLTPIKQKHDWTISVMIRQTDYRIFANGKYFFETEQYVSWMKAFEELYPNKNIGFVIASDEKQNEDLFKAVKSSVYFAPATATNNSKGDAHYMVNQVIHSKCDYMLSPPSTFTAWASFVGKVPLIPLISNNCEINIETALQNALIEGRFHPDFKESVQ